MNRIDEFNATYASTTDFEAKVNASDLALDLALEDSSKEALFAASLLHHSKHIALGFAWEYHCKHPRTWMQENLEFEITNDLFTLDVVALHKGKVRFVPCEGVTIKDMHRRAL